MARSVVRCRTSCCLPSEGEKARDGGWPRRRCMRRMCRRRRMTAPQPTKADTGAVRGSREAPVRRRGPGQPGTRSAPDAPDSAGQCQTTPDCTGRRRKAQDATRRDATGTAAGDAACNDTGGHIAPPLHFRPPSSACLSPDAHLSRGVQTRGPSCVPVHALRHPVGKGNTPPSSARMEGPRRFRPGHPRRPPNLSDRLTTPACAEKGITAQNIIQHTRIYIESTVGTVIA